MKRFVTLTAALVLLIVSLCMPSENLHPTVSAGAGRGENTEVTTPKATLDVLKYFLCRSDKDQGEGEETMRSGVVRLSSTVEDEAQETEEGVEQITSLHSSLTLVEESTLSSKMVYKRATGIDYTTMQYQYESYASRYVDLTRSLTIYITEDASYYVSRGVVNYRYDHYTENDLDSEECMSFDAHIYVDGERGLVKFNNISGTVGGMKINSEIAGQWIQLPKEAAVELVSQLDDMNRQYANMLMGYIEDGVESEFEKDGNIYTMHETIIEENDTEIRLDLSDAENPNIIFKARGSDAENDIDCYLTYSFLNVDNTVIELNATNVRVFETMEEFEEFMGG